MTKKTSRRSSESKMRSSMRQGQQKIKLDIKKPTPTSPPLPLPFPPTQKVEQIVAKLVAKPRLARFPNAFIMYRNEYVQYLKSQGYHISMTELSPMISASWKKESEYVKDAYTKLSSEAEKMYVRDTGSTQPQINYKYLPTQRPTLTTKIDTEIVVPKFDDPGQTQTHHAPNYADNEFFNIYDRLLFQLSSSNGFSRNYAKEPSVNGEVPPFSIGATELAKYSLDATKIDGAITQNNCFSEPANFFTWPSNLSSPIQEFPNNHLSTVPQDCYSPTFSPNTSPLDDLINSGLSLGQLESMSPCSTSSSPSDTTSFDEFSSLLFSPDLNETGGFFDKTEFSASTGYPTDSIVNVQSPLQSPDLYLYSGQSFTTQ